MNITLDHPLWAYLICTLVGMVFSFVLYFRQNNLKSLAKWVFYLLLFLRFSLGFLLTLLLFNPLLNYPKTITEKPIIVVLHDNSSSIVVNKDSSFIKNEFQTTLNNELSKVSKDFTLEHFTFGEHVNQTDSLSYNEKLTDISSALNQVSEKYYNQNLAAVMLISDGIYNTGENPLYASTISNTPIYSIALGDTLPKKDVFIKDVLHNNIAFLGNKFPVKVSLGAQKLEGENVTVSIFHQGKLIEKQNVEIDDDNYLSDVSFLVEAKDVGIQSYTVKLSEIDGEFTFENNAQTFYVEVLDGRQKILLLAASPHPDIAAIRSTLESNKNYEVVYKTANNFKPDNTPYDLVVLHNLPSSKYSFTSFLQKQKSTLFVLGSLTDYNLLSNNFVGFNLGNVQSFSSASPKLNSNFSLFNVSDELNRFFKNLPPLEVPFLKEYNINKQHVLATQSIGNVSTSNPLIGFYNVNQKKYGYILGEGIWRWKIEDFKQNKSHQNFNDIVTKLVQYLSSREDKSFFRVSANKAVFNENEVVKIKAELYNKAYELTNNPEVDVMLTNAEGEQYSYQFSKLNKAYEANVSGLPPGQYTYVANTELNGEKFSKTGAFSIKALKQELLTTQANHQLLYQLSEKSGGRLIDSKNIDNLVNIFTDKESFPDVIYTKTTTESSINLKWIFILLVALVGIEWFVRKREGGY